MSDLIVDFLISVAEKLGIPNASLLGIAVKAVLEKRQEAARAVLVEELMTGTKRIEEIGQVDEAAAITYRYIRAAQEGTARLNLRLLAKIFASQTRHQNLIADEFLYWADILSNLRREEIILIATLHKEQKKLESEGVPPDEISGKATLRTKEALVPSVFKDEGWYEASLVAAQRTGLIVAKSGWGMLVYHTSPLLDRLLQLADLEAALAQEP